ncbi:MAG: N-acetyltransferase domain-containing protein [Sporanaerobacter sp.]|uniref:GNAT family N-acetyltransferase n=1 Tax=Sporanaerobacter sp. TaxID=2010183 RepID=UPI003A0FFF90
MINDREVKIGELTGHFFNLSALSKDKQNHELISLLHYYNEETFDISRDLIKETSCYKTQGENIYHLDRFYIYPEYRGNGVGKIVLDEFIKNISAYVEDNVRYIGLFPDPITDDIEFDSKENMDICERGILVKHLKSFYSSFGFQEMKTNREYMYLDLNKVKWTKRITSKTKRNGLMHKSQ